MSNQAQDFIEPLTPDLDNTFMHRLFTKNLKIRRCPNHSNHQPAIDYPPKIKARRSPHHSNHQTAIAYSQKIKNAITSPVKSPNSDRLFIQRFNILLGTRQLISDKAINSLVYNILQINRC
ncbi:MAG: hypothetical protein M1G31_11080 [Pseudanabaena sp. Salubria-1]|nr:hypothetical protein [Pseudanabaena sp. Salubria-1]